MVSAVFATVLTACSVIDENLDDCGEEIVTNYDLRLLTNVNIELQTVLDQQSEASLIKALREYLAPIFTDKAHDVDLSFYDTQDDSVSLYRDRHIMDANQQSYTLYLPRRDYMHIAVANVEDNRMAHLDGIQNCHTSRLSQVHSDTVASHKTGLFTARQMIRMKKDVSQDINVHLYMANCAAALILDTSESSASSLSVVSTGFASRFNLADSIYVFDDVPPVVVPERIESGIAGMECLCAVNFPSRMPASTQRTPAASRMVIETEDPSVGQNSDHALWMFRVYVTQPDGKVTLTELGVHQPLQAGQLKIIRAKLRDQGIVAPEDQEVSVSVTLDWKEGNQHQVDV